ncbi:hypothetical protein Vretimale_17829 [Volvox reticuliferus]|uniref:Kazal-like domain-containing protein n=1 Tax=Volvox reticuliferus TaxID=1737510 RepID=A0A8J4LYW5_9CHLO|nr:hypothetical protein Vretimale_17829 [Volvox reticuliferus]
MSRFTPLALSPATPPPGPHSSVTLDSAQRCAACPPETQLVCCRRRATYVNACKAAACSGELPTSCTPGACKAPEDLVQTGGLVSVLGLPALMPAVREPMGSGSVSGRGNGSAAVAVTKTPAEPVTAVQAFDGRHDSSELPVDVWVAKQPQRGGADRAPGDENGTPPAGAGQGASHLGPATAQPQQQTVTEPALMQLFAAAATPAPASAVPIVPQVLSPTVPAMASEMAPALRQALAFQLTQTASSLPTVQEPSKTTSPGAIAAPASTSIRPLAVSVPAAGASTPATEFRPPTPASQAAPPVSMPEGLGTGKAAVPITVQAPLPTPGPPTAAAVAAPTAVAAAMAVAASTAATADLTTAPSTGGVFAPQQHPDPPFWMPQSCDCPLDWEPICCGGRTFMNRCTAVCVGGVVDTGHCSPVLSGEQCVPTAADATEPALQHGEPQAAVSAPKEMQQPQQAAVQGLQTAQHVNQAQPTAQGHLAAGLTANKLSLVRQPPQQAP